MISLKDEIKEIDNSDLMELLETTSKKDFYRLTLDHELVVRLYNWITNLQQEIERLRNEIKKISEQHIYTLDKLIETQTRIEKTIEYIKENGYIDLNGYDLLKITGGDEE